MRNVSRERTMVIGDVHGCSDALRKLLGYRKDWGVTSTVLVGDLVDKGSDPVGAVRYAKEAGCLLVKGNHEFHHQRFWRASPELRERLLNREASMMVVESGLRDEEKQWIKDSPLYYVIPGGFVVVHAGIPGTLERLNNSLLCRRSQRVMFTRKVDSDGNFLSLSNSTDEHEYWAEIYDGRFGHVIFGHEVHPGGIYSYKHATAVDTGAVHGGGLSAVILEGKKIVGKMTVPTTLQIPNWK